MSHPSEFPHDFPLIGKTTHIIHAFSIIILTITGIFIRFPVWDTARIPMRIIHYIFMTIVVAIYMYRVAWAFLGKKKDYHDFAPGKLDLQVAPKTIMYYAFLKPDYPHLQKFNPLQKMTYLLFFLVMPFQAYTGFCLVWPFLTLPIAGIFSGVAGAVAYMRWFHWCGMLFFAMFTMIHIYLALTENFYAFQYFFFIPLRGKAREILEESLRSGEVHGEHKETEKESAPEGAH